MRHITKPYENNVLSWKRFYASELLYIHVTHQGLKADFVPRPRRFQGVCIKKKF